MARISSKTQRRPLRHRGTPHAFACYCDAPAWLFPPPASPINLIVMGAESREDARLVLALGVFSKRLSDSLQLVFSRSLSLCSHTFQSGAVLPGGKWPFMGEDAPSSWPHPSSAAQASIPPALCPVLQILYGQWYSHKSGKPIALQHSSLPLI